MLNESEYPLLACGKMTLNHDGGRFCIRRRRLLKIFTVVNNLTPVSILRRPLPPFAQAKHLQNFEVINQRQVLKVAKGFII